VVVPMSLRYCDIQFRTGRLRPRELRTTAEKCPFLSVKSAKGVATSLTSVEVVKSVSFWLKRCTLAHFWLNSAHLKSTT
jgi:hypothetical protein